jgi:hypothetical protein
MTGTGLPPAAVALSTPWPGIAVDLGRILLLAKTSATACGRWEASCAYRPPAPPARAANRDADTQRSAHAPTTRTTIGAALGWSPPYRPRAAWQAKPATNPSHHHSSHRPARELIMRTPVLWQIDMGDGSWAVSCRTCRLTYRGPKTGADLLFDTHQCEPVVPRRAQTR